jgi:hypothetical protein
MYDVLIEPSGGDSQGFTTLVFYDRELAPHYNKTIALSPKRVRSETGLVPPAAAVVIKKSQPVKKKQKNPSLAPSLAPA